LSTDLAPPDSSDSDGAVSPAPLTGEAALRSSYQALPYSVNAFPQTLPDRLASIGRLFNLETVHPDCCRVLELGCASGGNLIPMALASPQSRFVGIDLAAGQIADGQKVVRELGLDNVELREGSILDVGGEIGSFDYILVHGVFSWVPPDVQEKILEICRRQLSPNGVAYISYNTYPGWHARGAIREMLWYHTAALTDPAERVRQARALLAFLAQCMPNADGSYGSLLRQELLLLLITPDTYLLHEHLDEVNEPLYFHQFAQRAAAHQLQYLGEAHIGMMAPGRFGESTEKLLRHLSRDLLHMEQYMDFLRNRMFRQTLLCHAEASLNHGFRAQSLYDLYLTSHATSISADPENPETLAFAGPGKLKLATRDPLMKAAMTRLAHAAPAAIAFADLHREACQQCGHDCGDDQQKQKLANRLLNGVVSGLLDLTTASSRFTTAVSDRPVASPYARLRSREKGKVVNMRLETVQVTEATRELLALLDGRHDRAALPQLLQRPPEEVEADLQHLATSAVLIG